MKLDKYFRKALVNLAKHIGIYLMSFAYIGTIVALLMNGAVWSSVIAVMMVALVAIAIVMIVANEEAQSLRRWSDLDED